MMLEMSGLKKVQSADLLGSNDGEKINLQLDCTSLSVSIERRIQRTVVRGGEGDDLLDEGAESAVYDAEARVSHGEYADVMGLFRGSDQVILDPFEGGEVKVAFKSLSYDGKVLRMTLIEDID